MNKNGIGKIILLFVILGILCYLYFADKLTYEYAAITAEGMREILKHILIEIIEHIR